MWLHDAITTAGVVSSAALRCIAALTRTLTSLPQQTHAFVAPLLGKSHGLMSTQSHMHTYLRHGHGELCCAGWAPGQSTNKGSCASCAKHLRCSSARVHARDAACSHGIQAGVPLCLQSLCAHACVQGAHLDYCIEVLSVMVELTACLSGSSAPSSILHITVKQCCQSPSCSHHHTHAQAEVHAVLAGSMAHTHASVRRLALCGMAALMQDGCMAAEAMHSTAQHITQAILSDSSPQVPDQTHQSIHAGRIMHAWLRWCRLRWRAVLLLCMRMPPWLSHM